MSQCVVSSCIMYHTEIGICHKLKQIATKKRNKKTPSVGAHCVAEPDVNQRRKFLRMAKKIVFCWTAEKRMVCI